MRTQRTLWTVGLLVLLLLARVSGAEGQKVIAWDKAAEHIGETVTVEGPVVDAKYAASSRGAPTFLNMGKPYPDPARFTVVIWGRNRGKFAAPPEETYQGKTIRVTGKIETYRGLPQIEVREPSAISVVKGSASGNTSRQEGVIRHAEQVSLARCRDCVRVDHWHGGLLRAEVGPQ